MEYNFFYNRISPSSGHNSTIRLLEEYDHYKLFWGEEILTKSIKAEIFPSASGIYNDLLYSSTDLLNFAISDRLRNILLNDSITGWSTYELNIINSSLKYYGFILRGRCGALIKQPAEKGIVVTVQGLNFDINTWDGSDFFCPSGAGHLLCTERVRDLFKKNQIKSTVFVNTKEVQWRFID